MLLNNTQIFITIIAVAAGAFITRSLSFIIFPNHEKTPKYVRYLAIMLPSASIGLLVVYCLKDAFILQGNLPIAEAISILIIIVLHLWKRNALISIFSSTVVYMLLKQFLFSTTA